MAFADFEVAVIGAGPGGLVSALYLRRFLRSTVVISHGPPRASWIPRTHNLFGYRGGISGVELLNRLQKQLDELGVERAVARAEVRRARGGFRITGDGVEVTAKKVVLATGMKDVDPPLKNLFRLRRRGLLRYCPVCDAYEYRGRRIVVLARDAHGLKASLFLARFSRHVNVLWPPGQKPPAKLVSLLKEAGARVTPFQVEGIEDCSNSTGLGIHLHGRDSEGRRRTLDADVAYIELGVTVNDSAFSHFNDLERTEPSGRLVTDAHQELSVPGLFAVGDCVEGLAQIAVAAGQAAIAATRIHNQLRHGRE